MAFSVSRVAAKTNMSSSVLSEKLARFVRPVVWREVGPAAAARASISQESQPLAPPIATVPSIDVDAIARDAYAQGFRDAEKQAAEQAAAQMQPLMDRFSKTLTSLAEQRSRIRRESEVELVQLSLAIAKRILNRELTIDPTSIEGLLKAALDKAQAHEICRIRMHPDQDALVRSCLSRLMPARNLEFVSDGSLRPWDVLFETRGGWLDASLDTQLKEIERGFEDRLEKP